MEFEQKPGRDKDGPRIIIDQLLLSEEMQPVDLPYILPCYYWVKMHLSFPHVRLSPLLRMQCNERQRRLYRAFDHIVVIKNDTELARNLTGIDTYDNSIRLCAFLELFVERYGPFGVLDILNRILRGRKHLRYGNLKLDHLTKASPDSINNLIATVVHSLSQHLAVNRWVGHQLQRVADAISLVLSLSGERELGKVFRGALPKLVAGEVTLCYSLLLATDLTDEEGSQEMWTLFVQKMDHDVQAGGGGIPIAVIAIAVVLYACRDGSQVLFPKLYIELSKRNLPSHAKMAWELLGGDGEVWNEMVREFQRNLEWQTHMWDNREAYIEIAWRDEVARERSGGAR